MVLHFRSACARARTISAGGNAAAALALREESTRTRAHLTGHQTRAVLQPRWRTRAYHHDSGARERTSAVFDLAAAKSKGKTSLRLRVRACLRVCVRDNKVL